MNEKACCPTAKIVIQKHPYNVSVPRPKARTLGGNHLLKKMLLSHDQIFNLVTHCLDDLEIPIFLNSYQCIKIKPTNPRVSVSFLECVLPFVHLEITCLFGMKKTCKIRRNFGELLENEKREINREEKGKGAGGRG